MKTRTQLTTLISVSGAAIRIELCTVLHGKRGGMVAKYDGSKLSDFFDLHRRIRFRRNQLVLRDDILNQIGSELTRVGREYDGGYSFGIAPTATLPRVDQIDDLESRLKREEISFTEVINFCLKT